MLKFKFLSVFWVQIWCVKELLNWTFGEQNENGLQCFHSLYRWQPVKFSAILKLKFYTLQPQTPNNQFAFTRANRRMRGAANIQKQTGNNFLGKTFNPNCASICYWFVFLIKLCIENSRAMLMFCKKFTLIPVRIHFNDFNDI